MGVGAFVPFSEAPSALFERTVGREGLLRRLRQSADERKGGGHPLSLYLFGPSGVGKSHLAALARAELAARGLAFRFASDDLPAMRSAAELLAAGTDEPPASRASVLLVEGLDRRLAELGSGAAGHAQRQKVRGAWSEQGLWVIATGERLGPELTEHSEPFYGWFDPEPIEPLSEEQAQPLLQRVLPAQQREHPRWSGQQAAWLACAAGYPRTLMALAEACALSPRPLSASEALQAVVERFAGQSRAAFRALSPVGQHIAWKLACSPRAATPGELAQQLQTSPQSLATAARRLAEDGVLSRTEDGRFTWYVLADPVLRFWIEASACRWVDTRVALACELLEAWATHPPPETLQQALSIVRGGEHIDRARALSEQLGESHLHPELARLRAALPSQSVPR